MKKFIFLLAIVPSLSFADRLGGLNPNSQVALSTQTSGASVNVSPASVLFSTGGTTISGNTGFQYDQSVSSVTLGGQFGETTNSTSILLGDGGNGDPTIQANDLNGTPGGGYIYSYSNTPYDEFVDGVNSFQILVTSHTGLSTSIPSSRLNFPRNSQSTQITNTAGSAIVQFDPIGNSSFTIPIVVSTITINKQTVLPYLTNTVLATDSSGIIISTTVTSGGSITPGSTFYIQNTNTLQSGANFDITSGQINGQLILISTQYASTPVVIKATTSQTADLMQFKDSLSQTNAAIDFNGDIILNEQGSLLYLGGYPSAPGIYRGIWPTLPSGATLSNYYFLSDGRDSYINSPVAGHAVNMRNLNNDIIDFYGDRIVVVDGIKFVFGTTSGTQFGDATNEKIAFFGSSPIVQPSNTTDIRVSLINLGLLGSGGANPLDLNGGNFSTTGTANVGGIADSIQLIVKGNSSQTADLLELKNNAGTKLQWADKNGILNSTGTVLPALTSCGTGPIVRGTDEGFTITPGTGASGCTATFGGSYSNSPSCTVTEQTMSLINALSYTESNTAVTITQTSLSSVLDVVCKFHG